MHVLFLRLGLEIVRGALRDFKQIKSLLREHLALVKLGKADYITDKRHKSLRFGADMADEARHILRLHHAVFYELRTADDALKRRFQLVRDVRGELAAHLLRALLLRHVENQYNGADSGSIGIYAADVDLIDAASMPLVQAAMSALHRRTHRRAHVTAAVNRQKVLPRAVPLHGEDIPRRRVHAEDVALLVEQHKPLAHTARHLRKFVRAPPQFAQL